MDDVIPLAQRIDHTLLKATATAAEIETLCKEAAEHHFWSVCVNPSRVPLAVELLNATGVKVCTVLGFPLGATLPAAKADEAKWAIEAGAEELDMVVNIGWILDGEWERVDRDISVVVAAKGDALVKVILETCFLSPEQIAHAGKIAVEAGADFLKTSTGFGSGGATEEAVRALRQAAGGRAKVKASGGIRDRAMADLMIAAGADRLGTSASVAIVTGGAGTSAY